MKEKKGSKMEEFASKGTGDSEVSNEELENQAQNLIQKNSVVIIIIAVVIIAIAGYMYYSNMQTTERINEANQLLAKVIPVYEQANFEAALQGNPGMAGDAGDVTGLIDIAEKYDGVPTGAVAALLAGNTLILQDDYEKAQKYFEIGMDTDSKAVLAGSNAGIGACYENKGNYSEAANYYVNAAVFAETPAIKARYNLFAALAYEKDGNTNKAAEFYNKVVKDENQSEYTGDAKSGLTRLGMIIE